MALLIFVAFILAALVIAIVAEIEAGWRDLAGWAVVLICVALLWNRLG